MMDNSHISLIILVVSIVIFWVYDNKYLPYKTNLANKKCQEDAAKFVKNWFDTNLLEKYSNRMIIVLKYERVDDAWGYNFPITFAKEVNYKSFMEVEARHEIGEIINYNDLINYIINRSYVNENSLFQSSKIRTKIVSAELVYEATNRYEQAAQTKIRELKYLALDQKKINEEIASIKIGHPKFKDYLKAQ